MNPGVDKVIYQSGISPGVGTVSICAIHAEVRLAKSETMRSRPPDPLISVVCPMFREEATIGEFHSRLIAALDSIEPAVRFELIYVDDGSDDGSVSLVRKFCADDKRVKLVELARNFGHQLAITSGIDHASGDATVIIDTDLQDPPEMIPAMVSLWRDGNDVVDGQRTKRAGESRLMLFLIKCFYRLLGRLSDTPLPTEVGDFRLIDRDVRRIFVTMREENRYIRGMIPWIGFSRGVVPYERDSRFAGASNYRFVRRVRLAFDAIASFSERPLQIASGIGVIFTLMALALAAWIVISKLLHPETVLAGYGSLMVVVLFLGGVQLLGLGLVGAYVGRLYREVKGRPLYVVRTRVNLDSPTDSREPARPAPR